MNIAIIGTGNVAWHLGLTLENAGHVIAAIGSRDSKRGGDFCSNFYHADLITNGNFSKLAIDLCLICVADDAIEEVAQHLKLPANCILAHSSGTQPLSSLGYAQTANIGVFYPLQTFTKGKKVDFDKIPICLEADNDYALNKLKSLAQSISQTIAELNSKDRAVLHLSAVFASNFSNHMLTLAKGIMEQNEMNYDLLKPLITETINKSLSVGPEFAQTGPAKRGDFETLDKQFKALAADPETAALYQKLSQHILDFYAE